MTERLFDIAELGRIRARFGEAVVDRGRWRDLLEDMCRVVGAEGASLRQSINRTPDVPYTRSMEDLTRLYFREKWNLRDTRARTLLRRPMKRAAFYDYDVFTLDEMKHLLRRDPYFNDFLGAGKLRWGAWIQFYVAGEPWMVALQRTVSQGPFDAANVASLEPLARSLVETANLSAAVGHTILSGMLDALNLVRRPAIALDRNGLVLGANPVADALFDASLRIKNRKLVSTDEGAAKLLDLLYAKMRWLPEDQPLLVDDIIAKRFQKQPVLMKVLPVPVAARGPFLGARALLVLKDIGLGKEPDADLMLRMFGLTPAEARLAVQIASGVSPEQAAGALGIARETARNQLKAIFAKTETHRQGELIALLSRLC
jgi:DNA-binding CsgD family transcriptional regulator